MRARRRDVKLTISDYSPGRRVATDDLAALLSRARASDSPTAWSGSYPMYPMQ